MRLIELRRSQFGDQAAFDEAVQFHEERADENPESVVKVLPEPS